MYLRHVPAMYAIETGTPRGAWSQCRSQSVNGQSGSTQYVMSAIAVTVLPVVLAPKAAPKRMQDVVSIHGAFLDEHRTYPHCPQITDAVLTATTMPHIIHPSYLQPHHLQLLSPP